MGDLFCLVANRFFRWHYDAREPGRVPPPSEFNDWNRSIQIIYVKCEKIKLSEKNKLREKWIYPTTRSPKGQR